MVASETVTLKNQLRNLGCYLPKLGLVKKPNRHPHGLTFVVPLKDEEPWIRYCLQSILPHADEIIVVDSSVEDNSTEIVKEMMKRSEKIRHIRFYYDGSEVFTLAMHLGYTVARYKYVFKWDADLIAADDFGVWRKRLDRLDPDLYHVIQVGRVNLKGDLKHQPRDLGWTAPFFGREGRLTTWSPELHWVNSFMFGPVKQVDKREILMGDSFWGLRLPPWYRLEQWAEPYIFHCDVKPPMRRVTQWWWTAYVVNNEGFRTLQEYTEHHVRKDWKMSMEEACEKVNREIMDNLVPYDESKYGKLPSVLRNLG
jgi:glycosyltransferase involved in cell wall biosynthesis